MATIYNVLDTGAAATLIRSDALDLLTAGGRKVVITQQVLDELTNQIEDNPNQRKFLEWFGRNTNKIVYIDETITPDDIGEFNPENKPNQAGDISIKRYLKDAMPDGIIYEVISDDSDLIGYRPNGSNGRFYSSESSIGFFADAVMDKRVANADEALRIKTAIENSGRLGQISEKHHKILELR